MENNGESTNHSLPYVNTDLILQIYFGSFSQEKWNHLIVAILGRHQ